MGATRNTHVQSFNVSLVAESPYIRLGQRLHRVDVPVSSCVEGIFHRLLVVNLIPCDHIGQITARMHLRAVTGGAKPKGRGQKCSQRAVNGRSILPVTHSTMPRGIRASYRALQVPQHKWQVIAEDSTLVEQDAAFLQK
jgi:hypothetical protein